MGEINGERGRWGARTYVAALLTAIAFLLAGAAAAETPTPTPTPAPAAVPRAVPANQDGPRVTLVGIPGLLWSDITPGGTPALWRLAGESALAAMSVRTALPGACPLDGWLTLNSGARAVAPRPDGRCGPVAAPPSGWAEVLLENEKYSYDPEFGRLSGSTRPPAEREPDPPFRADCAVGPGAVVALSSSEGRYLGRRAPDVGGLPRDGRCARLLLVDAGALPPGPPRAAALRKADEVVAATLERAGSRVIVAGLADAGPQPTHLNALLVRAEGGAGWLRAESTRQRGLVQVTDLTPTLLSHLGESRDGLVGSVLEHRPREADTADAVRALAELDVAAQVVRTNFVPFFVVLVAGQLLAYAAVALRYRRGLPRPRAARAIRAIGLVFGAAPLATFLANLLPWRSASHPAVALWACLVGFALAVAAAAALGPWRRHAFGPAGAIAALTVAVLAVDVGTGSRLQVTALYGLSPLVAGRFYGFGNVAFGVFAMAALLAAAWAGVEARRRSGARAGAAAILVVGAAAVLVDGWPTFGADFGGVLALVPGVAILAFGFAGARPTPARVLGVVAATLAIVAAIAVADWTRPPASRSHLGNFVQDVVDGDAGAVLARKGEANLGLFVEAPIIAVAAVPLTVLVLVALFRPGRLRLHGLARAQDREPVLRVLLFACVGTAVLGFAVNDSGIIVPAVALTAAGPLVTALWAGVWAAEPT